MADDEAERFAECSVCGRTILRGERVIAYETPDGDEHGVCALCRERAEAAGWIRADLVAAGGRATTPRRRRGFKLHERLRGYAEKARPPRAETAPAAEPAAEARPEPVARPRPTHEPEPDTPERRIHRAIERFNHSDQVRVVAGLMRSLGEPTAAVEDVSARPARAAVTIAWELSWYRWDVAPDGGADAVREVAKGGELAELDGGEPEWNASVDGEGRVQWRESS